MNKIFKGVAVGIFSLSFLTGLQAQDIDDNPPGMIGGPGTNWENPPGWRGGPGASADRWRNMTVEERQAWRDSRKEHWQNMSDKERQAFKKQRRSQSRLYGGKGPRWDRDNNPPGRRGGPGTNWENPPGWRGGPGASPDRWGKRWDRDNNPPGMRGGPGTNWENPPGWRGGPGVSPDRR